MDSNWFHMNFIKPNIPQKKVFVPVAGVHFLNVNPLFITCINVCTLYSVGLEIS